MPSSTRYSLVTATNSSGSTRRCMVTLGVSSDRGGYLPSNRFSRLTTARISLLDHRETTILGITSSYEISEVKMYCPAPSLRQVSDILGFVPVKEQTRLNVVEMMIGTVSFSEILCNVPINRISDIQCYMVSTATESSDVTCFMPIAARTLAEDLKIDIAYKQVSTVNCITEGYAESTINCSIVTRTFSSNRQCFVPLPAEVDGYTQILCHLPKLVGDPVEYVAIEVVLGERHIDERICVVEIPASNYNDLKCSTSPVLAGIPRWNKFTTETDIFVRLLNIGSYEVTNAVLQDLHNSYEADEIYTLSSAWQVRFSKPTQLSTNYVVVLTIEPGHKIIVVDSPRGEFSL